MDQGRLCNYLTLLDRGPFPGKTRMRVLSMKSTTERRGSKVWNSGGPLLYFCGRRVCRVISRVISLHFKWEGRGAWVAQSVKHLTLMQVLISRFIGSSPTMGSLLTAQSLEPAWNSVAPSFSAPPLLVLCLSLSLSLSLSKINKH